MRLLGPGPGTPWAMTKREAPPGPWSGRKLQQLPLQCGQRLVTRVRSLSEVLHCPLWAQAIGSSSPAVLTVYYLQANEPREEDEGRDL